MSHPHRHNHTTPTTGATMRAHPRNNRVPNISEGELRNLASQLTRIDTLHREGPSCWVAIVECADDEMQGRKHLIAVAQWMPVPNVVGRYVVKLLPSPTPSRVRVSYRYYPDEERVTRFDLTINGEEFWRGVRARAFTSRTDAAAWLRGAEA